MWPARRPGIPDFGGAEDARNIVISLKQAGCCLYAVLELLRDSACEEHVDPAPGRGGGGAAVDAGWPSALPLAVCGGAEFVEVAAACRALNEWLLDVDWALQSASASQQGGRRQLLETAGWAMVRCAQEGLHVAGLAMGAAAGLWARDATLDVLRTACTGLRDLIMALQQRQPL